MEEGIGGFEAGDGLDRRDRTPEAAEEGVRREGELRKVRRVEFFGCRRLGAGRGE